MEIDKEFDRLKNIRANKMNIEVVDFLEKARVSIKTKSICNLRDQFKRCLMYYAAIGNCTQLLLQLIEIGTQVDDLD